MTSKNNIVEYIAHFLAGIGMFFIFLWIQYFDIKILRTNFWNIEKETILTSIGSNAFMFFLLLSAMILFYPTCKPMIHRFTSWIFSHINLIVLAVIYGLISTVVSGVVLVGVGFICIGLLAHILYVISAKLSDYEDVKQVIPIKMIIDITHSFFVTLFLYYLGVLYYDLDKLINSI
ncbi:MAG: hypothetical protein GY828_06360 [Candidatus Gracilibacteria bacterium]|nr:hypothetical protein [Candidatus Gracilibacteria bacterium]